MKKPVLIIIPHGGYSVPAELEGLNQLTTFEIFMESDAGANELFNFTDSGFYVISSPVSPLFVDPDRTNTASYAKDGVIKRESLSGKKIFRESSFPDSLAASNIIERYYRPFHAGINEIIRTEDIRLILDCHTMMPVGPKNAADRGKPRPLISLESTFCDAGGEIRVCPELIANSFSRHLLKYFEDEEQTASGKLSAGKLRHAGHILKKYGVLGIPMLRLSVSRSLFINERDFNYDYLSIDPERLKFVSGKILGAVEACRKESRIY